MGEKRNGATRLVTEQGCGPFIPCELKESGEYSLMKRKVWRLIAKSSAKHPRVYRKAVRLTSPTTSHAIRTIVSRKPFLILSTGRTGTRWLANLLNQIPEAHILHEPVIEDRQAHVQAFNDHKAAEKYLQEFRLYDMALRCKLQNPDVYGEVNGNLRRHAAAFKALVPEIRILHLVRNGPDFVRSVISRNGFTDLDERNLIPPATVMEPRVWVQMNRFEKICWMWQYENSFLRTQADQTVRFEDIISDYQMFKQGILDPLELRLSEKTWADAVRRPQNETAAYSIGKWNTWSRTQQSQFDAICDQEMQQYQYDARSG